MSRLLYAGLDALSSLFLLFPLFLMLNKTCFHSGIKTLRYLVFTAYLSGIYSIAGLPTAGYIRFDPNFNLIPFAYMFSDYQNSLLNVLLFLPLGFLLPLYWRSYRKLYRTLCFGFFLSLFIELLQTFCHRATDINDLITNTIGALIGWSMAKLILFLFPSISTSRKTWELYLVCGSTFCVMFFLQPFFVFGIHSLFFA